jgi:hypothetical protein
LRPKLEPLIISAIDERKDKELRAVVKPRLQIFKGVYEGWLQTLRASQRALQPAYQLLRLCSPVTALVDADKSVSVSAEDFRAITKNFPQFIDKYWADLRAVIRSALSKPDANPSVDRLDLAQNWLKCGALVQYSSVWDRRIRRVCPQSAMLGWPRIQAHFRTECEGHQSLEGGIVPQAVLEQECPITLDEEKSASARNVIALAGLDVETTTIDDMDASEARFVCTACPNRKVYDVLTWRQVVSFRLLR